ncbi:MAG: hypothetical protein AAGM67_17405, partial [Bacteroidota bacterium]
MEEISIESAEEAVKIYDYSIGNGIDPSEASSTAYLRACCTLSKIDKALSCLESLEHQKISLKQRTIRPLLSYYSSRGNLQATLQVLCAMRQIDEIILEGDYMLAFQSCKNSCDEKMQSFFACFFYDFQEDHLAPEKSIVWEAMKQVFHMSSMADLNLDRLLLAEDQQNLRSSIDESRSLTESLRDVTIPDEDSKDTTEKSLESLSAWTSEVVSLSENGFCEKFGDQLQSVDLPLPLLLEIKSKLDQSVRSLSSKTEVWESFQTYPETKDFDVVIDGANIGYFRQNFPGAPSHLCYEQVDASVAQLKEIGRKPLLVLHERHFSSSIVPEEKRDL